MTYPSIAIIREEKSPPDARVPLAPRQVAELRARGLDIVVQPSTVRTFTDEEYAELNIPLVEDITDRALLLGVKEVPIEALIPGKSYCFFAHVAKEQAYNQSLLRALLNKGIRLYDYEYFTDENGARLIAFGHWAGMVGAHNAVWTYARRTGGFKLPRLNTLRDYAAAREAYDRVTLPHNLRVVLTGSGRVANGAAKVLGDLGFRRVAPQEFLDTGEVKNYHGGAVFTQLAVEDYVRHPSGQPTDRQHFYAHGEEYESAFLPYARIANVFINGIFWDGKAPAFFSVDDMRAPDFRIEVIGDITCDIAPASSVPSTLYATTIAEPVLGFDPGTGQETAPFSENAVDVMSIDNLPSELPRDASEAFGKVFIDEILPEFAKSESEILERANITRDGKLGPHFGYLKAFASGRQTA